MGSVSPSSTSASSLKLTYRPRIGRFGSTGAARAHTRGRVARSTSSLAPRPETIATCNAATDSPLRIVLLITPDLLAPAGRAGDEPARSPSLQPETAARGRRG